MCKVVRMFSVLMLVCASLVSVTSSAQAKVVHDFQLNPSRVVLAPGIDAVTPDISAGSPHVVIEGGLDE